MSTITLELITSPSTVYGNQRFIELDLVNHVHKRLEHFAYLDDIKSHAVPLDYFETHQLDSKYSLSVLDRSYQMAANSASRIDIRTGFDKTLTNSYSSPYSNILATNVTFVDQLNKLRPLFYKHILPANTVSVELEVIQSGNSQVGEDGYELDLTSGFIYTNYLNYFDQETGAYRLYFITSTDSLGVQSKTLLTPVPVVQEATWEDIDPDTGDLVEGNLVFTRERNTSGYSFYFNVDGPWWIRPQEFSLITCRYPIGRTSDSAWYVRVTNGDITSIINGAARRYHVPEYLTQPYQPSFPYIFSSYGDMIFVSKRVLSATRGSLAIDPENDRHLVIYISDFEDNLLRVWTTDSLLAGERYSNTGVFYEDNHIVCWDNMSGIVVLSEDILPSWQFKAEFYYSADDLEYTSLDLNPIQDPNLLRQTVVLYLIPNAGIDDTAVNHLLVEPDGVISYCSQKLTTSYPNLQLTNDDGSYNPDTVVGLKYISDIDTSTFITRYGAGFENNNGYMIIAEINVVDRARVSEAVHYGVKRLGDSLVSRSAITYYKNPRALYSQYGYSSEGQRLPTNNTLVVQVPIALLVDYGGVLQEDRIVDYVKRFIPAGVYPLIEWVYPHTEVSVDLLEISQITLTCSWEGLSYIYKIYRKFSLADQWELLVEAIPNNGESLVYVDTDLKSGDAVYYEVRLESTHEFPAPYYLNVRVS